MNLENNASLLEIIKKIYDKRDKSHHDAFIECVNIVQLADPIEVEYVKYVIEAMEQKKTSKHLRAVDELVDDFTNDGHRFFIRKVIESAERLSNDEKKKLKIH